MPWSSRKHSLDETEPIGFLPIFKNASPYLKSLNYYLKGYLRYKTIFCNKLFLNAQLMIFFIRRKKNVSF